MLVIAGCLTMAASGAEVLPVARFGAVGDGTTDDRAAIQRAIDAAAKAGPGTTVQFGERRTYWLGPPAPAFGVLLLSGADGVTLDGRGSTLLAHPANRILAIYGARRIVVRDLVIDYSPLPFTQGRLRSVDAEAGVVEFAVQPGYQAPVLGGEELYRNFKTSDCVFIGADGAFTHAWLRLRAVSQLPDGAFQARFHGSGQHVSRQLRRTRAGDFIALKLLWPEAEPRRAPDGRFMTTGVANLNIAFSEDVRLCGITSYAAPGMTFNAHGSEGIVLDRCAVVRKPGTDRLIAGQSDGCHLKSLTVMPRIRDCRFEALMDDSINVKISSETVEQVEGRRVLVSHGDILYNDTVVKVGDEMELYSPARKAHMGYGKVAAVERVAYRRVWLTFDQAPGGLGPGDLLYHRPVTPVEVRGVTFGSQLKTALVMRPPGTVADCDFGDVAYGVHAFVNDTIEGCMPREIEVTNCIFRYNTITALGVSVPSLQAVPPSRFMLSVTGCRFILAGNQGRLLSAYNASGILFRECSATVEDGRLLDAVIDLHGCANVDTRGLTPQPSPR